MKKLITAFCWLLAANCFSQPNLKLPEESQHAEITQRIGLTDVAIVYHSPLVNARKIWGGLVPYGKVWRAGANENTTISFTDDVKIDGNVLAAGTYGFHIIPEENEWTLIFSKNHTSWGSFFYKQDEDALRIKVKPEAREFQEWLDYNFTERLPASSKVTLSWEKIKVSFKVEVDVHAVTLRHIREQLKDLSAFWWHAWEEAAHYCIMEQINYEEALKWANRSIQIEENFTNTVAKAQLLRLMDKKTEAEQAMDKVIAMLETAKEGEVNRFGYELMGEKDVKGALTVFSLNVKKHPDSWNAYDSMAEAYGTAGDAKQSLSNYKLALSKAPADQKDRIQQIITNLEKK